MDLNLREIINIPGGVVPFELRLDLSDLSFESVREIKGPVTAKGQVSNNAGILTLQAEIQADIECICARCLTEFPKHISIQTEAGISEEETDRDNPDIYFLEGDSIYVDEVITTAFVLNMEQRFLCSENCKGLCDKCGKNLNDGPCNCKAEPDPRLAVLAQLLEKE